MRERRFVAEPGPPPPLRPRSARSSELHRVCPGAPPSDPRLMAMPGGTNQLPPLKRGIEKDRQRDFIITGAVDLLKRHSGIVELGQGRKRYKVWWCCGCIYIAYCSDIHCHGFGMAKEKCAG